MVAYTAALRCILALCRTLGPTYGSNAAIEWRAFRLDVATNEPGSLPAAIDLVV